MTSEKPIESHLEIGGKLWIPWSEISFQFATSGGPGGQHVNKTETKVILRFDLAQTGCMPEEQRDLLLQRLANRVNKQGIIQVTSSDSRSQHNNRELAVARFVQMMEGALVEPKKRRPTRPSRGAKERRLTAKKQLGQRKKERNWKADE